MAHDIVDPRSLPTPVAVVDAARMRWQWGRRRRWGVPVSWPLARGGPHRILLAGCRGRRLRRQRRRLGGPRGDRRVGGSRRQKCVKRGHVRGEASVQVAREFAKTTALPVQALEARLFHGELLLEVVDELDLQRYFATVRTLQDLVVLRQLLVVLEGGLLG